MRELKFRAWDKRKRIMVYQNENESADYWDGTGIEGLKNPLLEEYVDCLHFTLSIGLDILDDLEIYSEPIAYDDIIEQFNRTLEFQETRGRILINSRW